MNIYKHYKKQELLPFSKKITALRRELDDVFSEIKGKPRDIITQDGTVLQKDTFILDFTTKPQNLLAAYLALKEPIRAVLELFVKLPGTVVTRHDDDSSSITKASDDDAMESNQSETQDSEEVSTLSSDG